MKKVLFIHKQLNGLIAVYNQLTGICIARVGINQNDLYNKLNKYNDMDLISYKQYRTMKGGY